MPRKAKREAEQPFAPELPAPKQARKTKAPAKPKTPKPPSAAEAVAALFSRDPYTLAPAAIKDVVRAARAARASWELKEATRIRKKEGGGDEDQKDDK